MSCEIIIAVIFYPTFGLGICSFTTKYYFKKQYLYYYYYKSRHKLKKKFIIFPLKQNYVLSLDNMELTIGTFSSLNYYCIFSGLLKILNIFSAPILAYFLCIHGLLNNNSKTRYWNIFSWKFYSIPKVATEDSKKKSSVIFYCSNHYSGYLNLKFLFLFRVLHTRK